MRHQQPDEFAKLLDATGVARAQRELIAAEGGTKSFVRGLYGCSEMLVDGFIDLFRAGILRRRVYPHALLQSLLDAERLEVAISEDTLRTLNDAGLAQLTARDFSELQQAGLFRDDVRFESGSIIDAYGHVVPATLADSEIRAELAKNFLGKSLRNGVLLHGGFFFGPKSFYSALRELPDDQRRQFAMQRISFINELYGADQALKVAQRRLARFVNTTMMVTGLGAAVSDGLADGRVVSGVGGQYNFVAMAHALPDARSILCLRSTRTSAGRTTSNIVWNYGHVTIPRHLRDIIVTEYGIADLRSRTDGEVVEALIQVMDARFQDGFAAAAKRSGKLRDDYHVPDSARRNTPQRLEEILRPYRARGLFGDLPFDGDFTADEIVIGKALTHLQTITRSPWSRTMTIAKALLFQRQNAAIRRYLERLALDSPASFTEFIEQRLVALALSRFAPK
ncbi:MAG TPA: acetyl-CoA hydrolase/transferase C-terminal domain-containing protein [Steroidobacteraceae bacterium]|nr:acetyl-CoA hydrolase/transferase C-terminal domain-containing protein [Steroidobacteraceae bacterium]